MPAVDGRRTKKAKQPERAAAALAVRGTDCPSAREQPLEERPAARFSIERR